MSVLLKTEKDFSNSIFYVIEDNLTNIISGDLTIQLGFLTLHNKATSKVNFQALSTNNIYLRNGRKKKVTKKLLSKYHKVFEGVGKHNKDQVHLFINDKVPTVARKDVREMREKVSNEFEMLRQQDIVEDVKDEPTPWISRIVVVPKNHDKTKIRL